MFFLFGRSEEVGGELEFPLEQEVVLKFLGTQFPLGRKTALYSGWMKVARYLE